MEITLSELLKTNLLEQSTKDSIIKAKKMRVNVKKSVIAQLEHVYETVEYIAGKRGQEPRFILENPREVESEYNQYANVGRHAIDWTAEIELFKSFIYQQVGSATTKTTLIYRSLGLTREEKSKIAHIRKAFFENADLETMQNYEDFLDGDRLAETQAYKIRGAYYNIEYKFFNYRIRQLVGVLNKVLEEANYEVSYKNSANQDITEEEYIEYKALKKRLEDKYRNDGVLYYKIKRKVENDCLDELGYKYAYELLHFYDNSQFKDSVGDQVQCKKNLYERMVTSAQALQDRFEKGQIDELHDTLFSVLMSKKEFNKFMVSFLNSYIFGSEEISEKEAKFVDTVRNIAHSMESVKKSMESNNLETYRLDRKLEVLQMVS